jgi:hypothetical protein
MDMATRQKWLKCAALVTIGFGVLTAAAASLSLQAPTLLLADIIIWPLDGAQRGDTDTTRLMFAIGGGVFAAWGVTLWLLAGEGMERAPDMVRRIVVTAALTWFVIDCTGSVLAGAALNIIPNLGFLAMFLLPWRGWQGQPVQA